MANIHDSSRESITNHLLCVHQMHKGMLLLLITSVSLAQKMLQQEKKAGSRFSMAGAGLKMLNTDKHKVIMNL